MLTVITEYVIYFASFLLNTMLNKNIYNKNNNNN